MDNAHCLRPTFTSNLVHTLLERKTSVNLIGPPGSGKRRLLADVRAAKLPDTLVLQVDLRAYKESYAGFLGALWRQCPQPTGKAPQDLGKLVAQLEDSGQRILLLLDNFDALLDNPDIDPKFDTRFHNHLNSLKNHPCMALACVTGKPHDQSVVFINRQVHGTSWLELEKWTLPALSRQELHAEIARHQPGLDASAMTAIVETVVDREHAYDLLNEILRKWANQEDAELLTLARLTKWTQQFYGAPGIVHTGGLYRWLRTLRAWAMTVGLDKLKKPFAALGSLSSGLGHWLERLTKGPSNKP